MFSEARGQYRSLAELSEEELKTEQLRLGLYRQLAGCLAALEALEGAEPVREQSLWVLADVVAYWRERRRQMDPWAAWREAV